MADASETKVNGLLGYASIKGQIEVLTGLHIGAGKDTIEIGGIDNPVVKTPAGDPYIPGSSLKGKMRFLMEWSFGKIRDDGRVWGWDAGDLKPGDPLLRIFGTAAKKEYWGEGPTRLLIRDASLNSDWRTRQLENGRELTESKTEVTIDRIAGKALDGVGARISERVPAGALFEFEATFRVYEIGEDGGQRDIECLVWAIQGLDLVEKDALGGSGSRGYGRVAFRNLVIGGPKGEVQIDNVRKGRAFDPDHPDAHILDAVRNVIGTV